jgi:D-beta-D-heptose 7-phosphate kinase / D-beta-D-heptose 1-phosphate adenosyltransferase
MELIIEKILNNINRSKKNVLVIGDFMIDEYLTGTVERVNPEAPVLILNVKNERYGLGGAGNVVRNLLSLGIHAYASTVIGDDDDVNIIKRLINENHIPLQGIFEEKNRRTTRKTRLIAKHQHLIRYDRESTHQISYKNELRVINYIKEIIDKIDAVILEDYGKGVLTDKVIESTIRICRNHNKFCLIDPNRKNWESYSNATIITPNKKEASDALGYKLTNEKSIEEGGFELIEKFNLPYLLITRSEEGMSLFIKEEKRQINIGTKTPEVFDSAGAGDTVIAGFTFGLINGLSFIESAHFSNVSAGIVVSKSGVATVSFDEVIKSLQSENKFYLKNRKHKSLEEIIHICDELRRNKQKIVFTNGCFDILHSGHIKYLEKARSLGDILIIGINSDASVKKLKGANRPINTLEDRIEVLSALNFVDYIVEFEEDTPYNLIAKLQPDILIKGGDYKANNVVGKEIVEKYGGKVIILPYIEGKSTSNLIEKLNQTLSS